MYQKTELTANIMNWFFKQGTNMFKDMDRAKKICEMRLNGATWKEIGATLKTDPSYARESVNRIIRHWERHQYLVEREKMSNESIAEKMYKAFRVEIEEICTPEILKQVTTVKLIEDEKCIGILCYVPQDGFIYIDALYILPEYRRKHKGKNAVLNWYEDFKNEEIRLHILNKNEVAQRFWNSIFEFEPIEINCLDTLYRVVRMKGGVQE